MTQNFKISPDLKALIIDDMAQMRSVMREQLTSLGLKAIMQAASGEEAITALRKNTFDIVFADYNLGDGLNGQQVLERAKELGILPESTIWLMVTAESARQMVSVAAENAPDDYIIKPFTVSVLQARISKSLQKRHALHDFHDALARGEPREALAYASALAKSDSPFSFEGIKQMGRLMLTLGDYENAKSVYRGVLARRSDLPFARLGLAKALRANGEMALAQVAALELKEQYPDLIGAYDVLLGIYEDTGEHEKAFEVARAASQVVPSAKRYSKVGRLALALGDVEAATKAFERASVRSAGPSLISLSDVALLLQSYLNSGELRRAQGLAADPRGQFKSNPAAEVLFNAVRAQCWRGLRQHHEANRSYQACKLGMATVPLDEACKQVCLAAAIVMGDHQTMEQLTVELATNHHDDMGLIRLIKASASGTMMASRLDELVDSTCERMRASLAEIGQAQVRGDFESAVLLADKLLKRAPESTAVLSAKARVLVGGMTQPAAAISLYPIAAEFVRVLESRHAERRGVAALVAELRRAMSKVKV